MHQPFFWGYLLLIRCVCRYPSQSERPGQKLGILFQLSREAQFQYLFVTRHHTYSELDNGNEGFDEVCIGYYPEV